MAGKKKKPGVKKDNRGGKRTNAGRKPAKPKGIHSDDAKQAWMDAADKLKEEHDGETIQYAALKMVYDDNVQDSVKASILKVYDDAVLIKETTQNIESKTEHKQLVIGLPKQRHDPAKLIPMDGGKDADRKKNKTK